MSVFSNIVIRTELRQMKRGLFYVGLALDEQNKICAFLFLTNSREEWGGWISPSGQFLGDPNPFSEDCNFGENVKQDNEFCDSSLPEHLIDKITESIVFAKREDDVELETAKEAQ